MRRSRQLLLISVACAGVVMVLLFSAVIAAHLMANREQVKAFIVSKTAQATGGELDYARLNLDIFPVPHLVARDIHLRRGTALDLRAKQLAVYPGLLDLLIGRVSIHRLTLDGPDARVHLSAAEHKPAAGSAPGHPMQRLTGMVGGIFSTLAAIDPGTTLAVRRGRAAIDGGGMPRIMVSDVNVDARNDDRHLRLQFSCSSSLFDLVTVEATASPEAATASGEASVSGLTLRPILEHADLPGGIAVAGDPTALQLGFRIDGTENVQADFNLEAPSLTVIRQARRLELSDARLTGNASLAADGLRLSIDTFSSQKPSLTLSASAVLSGGSLSLHAAAEKLDIATAATVTRAIAGDLASIRTAFAVAMAGRLDDAAYSADFSRYDTGWRLDGMQASGRLSRGRILIPGIDSAIEAAAGSVHYEDQHVDFRSFSGRFQGAAFDSLDAAIDWEQAATLSIASPSVTVDLPRFYAWISSLPPLQAATGRVRKLTGQATISHLTIAGPLTEPAKWSFDGVGTPAAVAVESTWLPFTLRLSDGRIGYRDGAVDASGVHLAFLDASVVADYRCDALADPGSAEGRITGSLGGTAVDWVYGRLSIPTRWRVKTPVALSDVRVAWHREGPLALAGELQTEAGVRLTGEAAGTPHAWTLDGLTVSDARASATLSARRTAGAIDLHFSGSLDGQTLDGLLTDNALLSGHLTGDFRSHIASAPTLSATVDGKLNGAGIHLDPQPDVSVNVIRFAVDGRETHLAVQSCELAIDGRRFAIDGRLASENGGPTFDLNVDADRLDVELIQSLQALASEAPHGDKDGMHAAPKPRGDIHLQAEAFTLDDYTWAPVEAEIHVDGQRTAIQLTDARLCGIATTGRLSFTPQGFGFHLTPAAKDVSLQESARCLQPKPITADATFDLSGKLDLPPTKGNITRSLTGRLTFSSRNGSIQYSSVLMKIFSVLNITEVFTGGKSDLGEAGYGYTTAKATAAIGGGQVKLEEILLDGNSLKLTGEGRIDLRDDTVDVMLLAAPLKTVDRIINKLPIINYLTGGTLVSIPLRVHGPLADPSVVPLSPSAVGKSLLNFMGRTLKAPFKLVEGAASLAGQKPDDGADRSASPPPTPRKESP